VGDRSPTVQAHARIPGLLASLTDNEALESYWLPTDGITTPADLAGFDGIWLSPGSPYRSEAGALHATTERFLCRYGLNPAYLQILVDAGLVVSGVDQAGDPRDRGAARPPVDGGHPVPARAVLRPPTWVHPLIRAFAAARAEAARSVIAVGRPAAVAGVAGVAGGPSGPAS
jgi:hypothetical protein